MTQHAVHDLACWRVPVLMDRHRRSLIIAADTSESAATRALVLANQLCGNALLDGAPERIHGPEGHAGSAVVRRWWDQRRRAR